MEGDPPTFEGGGESDATLAVSGLVIALAVVTCGLRFYTRIFTRQGLGWDDWLIFAAVIATLATAALLLWGNAVDPIGALVSENTDPRYVYTEQDVFYLKLAFVTSVLYYTIDGATKLGILFMYNRIFWVSTGFRYQLFFASFLVIGWWIGCTVATLTNCIPLEWSWINSYADPKYCFNYNVFWMASGACEIVLDLIILTLPIQAVLRMTLSFRRKITVGGIFLLGGFVIITGLVKVILGYPPGSRVPSYNNTEVWAAVHAGMSIVCASLPIFRPLVSRISKWSGWSFITKLSSALSVKTARSSAGQNSDPRSVTWSVVHGDLRHITTNNESDVNMRRPTATPASPSTAPQSPQIRDNHPPANTVIAEESPSPALVDHTVAEAQSSTNEKGSATEPMSPEGEATTAASTPEGGQTEILENKESSRGQRTEDAADPLRTADTEGPKGGPLRPNDSMV